MVGAPTSQTRKRKHGTPHDQPVVDVDTWLQEARQASDSDAVQWFTRTILHQATTTTQPCKRPRTLNAKHHRWITTLNSMEDLTRKHLRTTTHAYAYATTCAHAMNHLRDLESLYDSAIRAKRCYHDVVSTQLQDEMSILLTHQNLPVHLNPPHPHHPINIKPLASTLNQCLFFSSIHTHAGLICLYPSTPLTTARGLQSLPSQAFSVLFFYRPIS